MKLMTRKEVKRHISNVKATLAVEGLEMNWRSIAYCSRYLRGKISGPEVMENITKYILSKK